SWLLHAAHASGFGWQRERFTSAERNSGIPEAFPRAVFTRAALEQCRPGVVELPERLRVWFGWLLHSIGQRGISLERRAERFVVRELRELAHHLTDGRLQSHSAIGRLLQIRRGVVVELVAAVGLESRIGRDAFKRLVVAALLQLLLPSHFSQ